MMKILIYEDEFEGIKANFDALNILYFDSTLEYENVKYSQNFIINESLDTYDLVLVDIDLSENSEKDGISVINEIRAYDFNKPIIIITGSSKIEDSQNKYDEQIPIIIKPLKYKQVYETMKGIIDI